MPFSGRYTLCFLCVPTYAYQCVPPCLSQRITMWLVRSKCVSFCIPPCLPNVFYLALPSLYLLCLPVRSFCVPCTLHVRFFTLFPVHSIRVCFREVNFAHISLRIPLYVPDTSPCGSLEFSCALPRASHSRRLARFLASFPMHSLVRNTVHSPCFPRCVSSWLIGGKLFRHPRFLDFFSLLVQALSLFSILFPPLENKFTDLYTF